MKPPEHPVRLRPAAILVAIVAALLAQAGCSKKSADAADPKAPALTTLQARCKLEWKMVPGADATRIDQQCRCVAEAASRAIALDDLQRYAKDNAFPAEAEKAMRTIRTDCGRQSGLV